MKNLMLFIVFAVCFASCGDKKASKNDAMTELHSTPVKKSEETMEQQVPDLLGIQKRTALEAKPYNAWFTTNYESYEMDEDVVKQLTPLLKNINIKVFMGTWCGDSKEQTPPFYKILDATKYNEKDLTLITVSRAKTTPEKYEAGLDIIKVPTFIFYKNGKELNRIVEYPVESLEKDMLAILSGKAYKHAYAE